MRRFPLLLALVLASGPAWAQSRTGTTAATFLTLGTGARANALGQAFTAEAAGPTAMFWNPAGMARPYRGAVGGAFYSRTDRLVDVSTNAAAVAFRITGSGVLGVQIQGVDYGRMDVTTVDQPDGTGESFRASDFALGLTYAQPLTDVFYVGGSAKYVRQQIYDMSASTVAFDLGVLLQTDFLGGLRLGASISNFGGKMEMRGVNALTTIDIAPGQAGNDEAVETELRADRWDLPLSFRFGTSVPVASAGGAGLRLFADAQQTNDNNLNSDLGAELSYQTNAVTFDARAGYRDAFIDDVDAHLSFGGGVDVRTGGLRLGVDYAFVPSDYFQAVNVIDFRVHF